MRCAIKTGCNKSEDVFCERPFALALYPARLVPRVKGGNRIEGPVLPLPLRTDSVSQQRGTNTARRQQHNEIML